MQRCVLSHLAWGPRAAGINRQTLKGQATFLKPRPCRGCYCPSALWQCVLEQQRAEHREVGGQSRLQGMILYLGRMSQCYSKGPPATQMPSLEA